MSNKPELNEVSSSLKDSRYSSYDGILRGQDEVAHSNLYGVAAYLEIERDTDAFAVLQKRKMAVIAREWSVQAVSDSKRDQEIADFVTENLKNIKFDYVCLDLLDAQLYGYAVSEIIWGYRNGRYIVEGLLSRRPDRFLFDVEMNLRLKTESSPFKGEIMPNNKFVVHRFGQKYNDPYGTGLGQKLYWPVFFKKNGLKFWLIFSEKFGNPTAVGSYHNGASEQQKRALNEALESFSHDTAVTIPEGMKIELIEAKRSGSVDTYSQLMAFLDKQIAKAVLGETLTTDIGNAGSRAASQTHNEVRLELVRGDADLLSDTINEQLIKPLVAYNFPDAEPPKVWRDVSETKDLSQRVEIDTKLHSMGYQPTPEYIQETYGDGYELKESLPAAKDIQPKNAQFAEGDVPNTEDELAKQLNDMAGASLDTMINAIRKEVDKGTSLEAIKERLITLYEEMDTEELEALLQGAFISADLHGRSDVMDEGDV